MPCSITNKQAEMRAHSFFPNQSASTIYAHAADDCSLHFDLDDLTEKQKADHVTNLDLTAVLQVALTYIGKENDHVAMFNAFQNEPWRDLLLYYHRAFNELGISPVPLENYHYYSKHGLYRELASSLPSVDLVTLYMVSNSNFPLHDSVDALQISQNVNSKVHFTENAPSYGIPMPDTLLCKKADLGSDRVAAFFKKHNAQIMLKTLGLAGARNVKAVSSIQECMDYVEEYAPEMDIILQQKLDLSRFTEMTVDLIVSDDKIEIANTRRILFSDGLWVGNLLGGKVTITEAHEALLIKVGEYARSHGYSAPEGINCGVDYFISDDDIIVTEINARWTGGLFPAQMAKKLGTGSRDVVAFFDVVPITAIDAYKDFTWKHLARDLDQPFGSVPMGFGPYPQTIEGTDFFYVWQMVVGDLEAFKAAKKKELPPGILPTADTVSVAL